MPCDLQTRDHAFRGPAQERYLLPCRAFLVTIPGRFDPFTAPRNGCLLHLPRRVRRFISPYFPYRPAMEVIMESHGALVNTGAVDCVKSVGVIRKVTR